MKRMKKIIQKMEKLKSRCMMTVPYVKGLSEAFIRLLKGYRILTAVKCHMTLINIIQKIGLRMRENR